MERNLLFFFLFLLIIRIPGQIFTWKNPNIPNDSISADRVLSKKITNEVFLRDTADFVKKHRIITEDFHTAPADKNKLLGDLKANGSMVRGITFGNSQGTAVQSAMDIQISGKLSSDVSILANIYDHNVPMQADGYTQTLEDFDRIFLQLNIRNKTVLRAGHLDLDDNEAFFARYQRRSMGLQFRTAFGAENANSFNLSAGIARSEFHRLRFQPVEGNQGPYRLTGKNGETFITIISGSEEVYLDGIRLKRGETGDYTINYNTGELTFTVRRPVYRQNFITVSYNYTNRNYSRYQITGSIRHEDKKFKAGISWLIENDNKFAPLALDLTKEDQEALAAAGNDSSRLLAPSGKITEYSPNKILYRKKTDVSGYIYEYSTNPNETLYQVGFTYVGPHLGDYQLKEIASNGRVYEYVGNGNGDFSAVHRLPAPEKRQVLSVSGEYRFNSGTVGTDFSISNYDRNLFSKIGNEDNTGYAGRLFARKQFRIKQWDSNIYGEYRRIDRKFYVLDRINNVEFSRDFNLHSEFSGRTQDFFTLDFSNKWDNSAFANYNLSVLNEQHFYRGIKHGLKVFLKKGITITNGAASYLDTRSNEMDTNFSRGKISTDLLGQKGITTFGGAFEHNLRKVSALKMTDNTSYSWREAFAQRKIGDTVRTKLLLKAYFRDNDSVQDGRLTNFNRILGGMAESELLKKENTNLSVLLHYRKYLRNITTDSLYRHTDFITGNISYSQNLFNKALRVQGMYELGNGLEPRRQFQYIKVTDGLGVYKWTDYNNDGAQQLDEFEIAEYSDQAQYIRQYAGVMQYLPSNKNKLHFTAFIRPSEIFLWNSAFSKRWSGSLSLLSQNSYLKKNHLVVLNPFYSEKDQLVKNQNFALYAQLDPTDASGWKGFYRYNLTDNLLNSNYSREENKRSSHTLNAGYRFNTHISADWTTLMSQNITTSEAFKTRNFSYSHFETSPKVDFRWSNRLQSSLIATYRHKKREDGPEALRATELSGNLTWERNKSALQASYAFINNDFRGSSFSVVSNQLLEGLKPGKNQVWSVYLQQTLSDFIRLSISYDGRNSGGRTIHTGSMQVRASF